MEKIRYPATWEPLDLDSYIANFMENYEESETRRVGQHQQSLSIGSQDPYFLAVLATDTISADNRDR